MKLVLLTRNQFSQVVNKLKFDRCRVGNLPSPTLIEPLTDTVYINADQVEVVKCNTEIFDSFLNEVPISIQAIMQWEKACKAEPSYAARFRLNPYDGECGVEEDEDGDFVRFYDYDLLRQKYMNEKGFKEVSHG